MFDGTKQAEMLKRFARRYKLEADVKNYDLQIGRRTRASYHCAHPQLTRNRKLNDAFYRWQWKEPLGMKRPCGYVFLHGMLSRKWRVPETIFVIRTRELEIQLSEFPGQKKQISLDGSVRVIPNKRTVFYFSPRRKFDQAGFRNWLKRKHSS
jgi:hypothetical protein